MNRKQLIVLLVVVLVVGTAGWLVYQRGNHSWQTGGQSLGAKLLPGLPINDIAQITIQSGADKLTLAKQNQRWRVRERGDYPANFSQISDLLRKFADLKIIQSEEIGPSQLARFDLLAPGTSTNSGTLITFADSTGKLLASVLLGKNHLKQSSVDSRFGEDWPDGRYVMAGAGANRVAVVSDPLDDVQSAPKTWLDKTFFKIEHPKAISVTFPAATNSWTLVRNSETNGWQLAGAKAGEKLDPSKLDEVTSPFGSPNFDDVSPGVAATTNATTLEVQTFDGFTYAAKIGPERDGDYPLTISITAKLPAARVAGTNETTEVKSKLDAAFQERQKVLAEKLSEEREFEKWTYELPAYQVDSLLKPKSQFLAEAGTNVTNTLTSTGPK